MDRERTLWTLAIGWLLVVYLTLPFTYEVHSLAHPLLTNVSAHGLREMVHVLQYGILAVLVLLAVSARFGPFRYSLAFMLAMLGALGDQLIQGRLVDRMGEVVGLRAAVVGILVGLLVWRMLRRRDTGLPACSGAGVLLLAACAAIVGLAAFVAFNPDRPFGHRHAVPNVETFYSVFTLDELARRDARAAVSSATELAGWRDERQRVCLRELEKRLPRDVVLRNICRDLYARVLLRNQLMEQFQLGQAWVENEVGERWLGGLVGRTPIAWDARTREDVLRLMGGAPPPGPWQSTYVPQTMFASSVADGILSATLPYPATAVAELLPAVSRHYTIAVRDSFERVLQSFCRRYPRRDPFLFELRWHLFRRYHGAIVGDFHVAWGENRILEDHFPRSLAATGLAWATETKAAIVRAVPGVETAPYHSIVGQSDIYQYSAATVWGIAGAAAAACLAGYGVWRARKK